MRYCRYINLQDFLSIVCLASTSFICLSLLFVHKDIGKVKRKSDSHVSQDWMITTDLYAELPSTRAQLSLRRLYLFDKETFMRISDAMPGIVTKWTLITGERLCTRSSHQSFIVTAWMGYLRYWTALWALHYQITLPTLLGPILILPTIFDWVCLSLAT